MMEIIQFSDTDLPKSTMAVLLSQATDTPAPGNLLPRQIIQCMAYVILAVLVISCNVFILVLLKRNKDLFDMTTVFLYQALAVVNMFAGTCGAVYGIIMGPSSVWPLDKFSCAVLLRGHFLFLYQSAWILCSISVDRCLMINWPLRYPTIMTPVRAKTGLLILLVVSILPMIPILPIKGFPLFESNTERCAGNPFQIQGSDLAWVGVLFVFIAVPLLTSTTANVFMMRAAIRQRRRVKPNCNLVPSQATFDAASSSPSRPRTSTSGSCGSSVQHCHETVEYDLARDATLGSLPEHTPNLRVDVTTSRGDSVQRSSCRVCSVMPASDSTFNALSTSLSSLQVKPATACTNSVHNPCFNITYDLMPSDPTLEELSTHSSGLHAMKMSRASSTYGSRSSFKSDMLSHMVLDAQSTSPSRLRTDNVTRAANNLQSSRSNVSSDSRSSHTALDAIATISSRLRSDTATSSGSSVAQRSRDTAKAKAAAALSRHAAQLKTLRTIVALTIAYYISWLPITTYFILQSTGRSASVSQEFYFFALGMDICACWWNIIVYVITNAPLRNAAINMMKCR